MNIQQHRPSPSFWATEKDASQAAEMPELKTIFPALQDSTRPSGAKRGGVPRTECDLPETTDRTKERKMQTEASRVVNQALAKAFRAVAEEIESEDICRDCCAAMCSIEVFDFRKHWASVMPHLRDPQIGGVLDQMMTKFLAHEDPIDGTRHTFPTYGKAYDPSAGPWSYTPTDYWCTRAMEMTCDAVDRGDFDWDPVEEDPSDEEWDRYFGYADQFYPQPETLEWYQLQHGGRWLAPWLKEIGKRLFPKLEWRLMMDQNRGFDRNGFAYGTDEVGNIKVILDLLHFEDMTGSELIELVTQKGGAR